MKCPQCGKGGLNGAQGLRMHIGRVHSKSIISPIRRGPRRKKAEGSMLDGEASTAVAVAEAPTRRINSKDWMQVEVRATRVSRVVGPENFGLNFCPNCKFPIHLVDRALAKEEIDPSQFCANCTFPMNIIRTAIRISNKQTVSE